MKHFLATAALGALLIGAMPLSTFAETPKDQLIVATTMSNILTRPRRHHRPRDRAGSEQYL